MLDLNALNWTGPDGLRDRLAPLTDPRRLQIFHWLIEARTSVPFGDRRYGFMGFTHFCIRRLCSAVG